MPNVRQFYRQEQVIMSNRYTTNVFTEESGRRRSETTDHRMCPSQPAPSSSRTLGQLWPKCGDPHIAWPDAVHLGAFCLMRNSFLREALSLSSTQITSIMLSTIARMSTIQTSRSSIAAFSTFRSLRQQPHYQPPTPSEPDNPHV